MSDLTFDADAFYRFELARHERVASTYPGFFEPATARTLDALLDAVRVGRGSGLLDVATGPGLAASRAAERGVRVVGVDFSPAMVAQARARHPDVEFRQGDAEALPFEAETFDAVICNFGIGHFPSAERAVREFARVVRPGGRIALTWWNFGASARLNGVFLDAVAEANVPPPADVPAGPPMTRFSDGTALRALLEQAALDEIVVDDLAWTYAVNNLDEWWQGGLGSMVRAAAMIVGQPAAVQARIRRAFARLAEPYRTGDRFLVPMAAKLGNGRKP